MIGQSESVLPRKPASAGDQAKSIIKNANPQNILFAMIVDL
jgi:hypothetical protein